MTGAAERFVDIQLLRLAPQLLPMTLEPLHPRIVLRRSLFERFEPIERVGRHTV